MRLARLVLWRHGETDWNADGRMQGQLDSELTDRGLAQASQAAPMVASFGPQAVLTSDLRRASMTAAALASHTGLPVRTDKRLRETNLGDWQGLTHLEVDAAWPGLRVAWRQDAELAPPGGETRFEVAARARQVVTELDLAGGVSVAVLCTHSGLIASLVGSLLELPVQAWPRLSGIGNCHWAVLERSFGAVRQPPGPDGDSESPDTSDDVMSTNWRLSSYNAGALA